MIYFLSESEKKTAIKEYAGRQKTAYSAKTEHSLRMSGALFR